MSVVTIEQLGKVTLFTLNRPEKRNVICKETAELLQQGFREFHASAQRVAVITGAGNEAFSAGADVGNLPELWRCIGLGLRHRQAHHCCHRRLGCGRGAGAPHDVRHGGGCGQHAFSYRRRASVSPAA